MPKYEVDLFVEVFKFKKMFVEAVDEEEAEENPVSKKKASEIF